MVFNILIANPSEISGAVATLAGHDRPPVEEAAE
jgi:hypothetical protein